MGKDPPREREGRGAPPRDRRGRAAGRALQGRGAGPAHDFQPPDRRAGNVLRLAEPVADYGRHPVQPERAAQGPGNDCRNDRALFGGALPGGH